MASPSRNLRTYARQLGPTLLVSTATRSRSGPATARLVQLFQSLHRCQSGQRRLLQRLTLRLTLPRKYGRVSVGLLGRLPLRRLSKGTHTFRTTRSATGSAVPRSLVGRHIRIATVTTPYTRQPALPKTRRSRSGLPSPAAYRVTSSTLAKSTCPNKQRAKVKALAEAGHERRLVSKEKGARRPTI
jgi:hypothetical protein